jgi:hypothetical protein
VLLTILDVLVPILDVFVVLCLLFLGGCLLWEWMQEERSAPARKRKRSPLPPRRRYYCRRMGEYARRQRYGRRCAGRRR